jgi:hypothetical protein
MMAKNPRQKTAGGGMNTHMAAHTSHNFNKYIIKSNALTSLNSQIQSQSSTQLPSAMQTGNLQKLSKK